MNDADRPGQGANAESTDSSGEVVSRYEVVPYAAKTDDSALYSFRESMPVPAPAVPVPTAVQQAAAARKNLLMMAGAAGLALLLIVLIAVAVVNRQESAPSFIDLGANNLASAGLAGRLIVKWDGKAEYKLLLDPLTPAQIPGFSAVAANPPQTFSVDLRLKDPSGSVVCQRQILFPVDPAGAANPADVQPLVPSKTVDGDIVQNVAGTDGQINEIVANGQLPCPVKEYKRLSSWDFSSNFPSPADQEEWRKHELNVEATLRQRAAEARARAFIPRIRPLPAPIDGDDVIVFDNPSKGMIETKAGRVFFVGREGLRGRAPGWQIFPASIHFHCDVKANCVLTRPDATSTLQARFVH